MEQKKKKKSKFKLIFKNTVLNVLFCVSIYFIAVTLFEIPKTFSLINEYNNLQKTLETAKYQNAELQATKEKLEDPYYVQMYARGKYMFSQESEKIFYLPAKDE